MYPISHSTAYFHINKLTSSSIRKKALYNKYHYVVVLITHKKISSDRNSYTPIINRPKYSPVLCYQYWVLGHSTNDIGMVDVFLYDFPPACHSLRQKSHSRLSSLQFCSNTAACPYFPATTSLNAQNQASHQEDHFVTFNIWKVLNCFTLTFTIM